MTKWARIKEFLSPAPRQSKEEHEREMARIFEHTKKLSDLIGMVIRLGVVIFAVTFFYRQYEASAEPFSGYGPLIAVIASVALGAWFALCIYRIIWNYFHPMIAFAESKWAYFALTFLVSVAAYSIFYSMIHLGYRLGSQFGAR